MSCNRIHLRQLGRQCCFLNLTTGATKTWQRKVTGYAHTMSYLWFFYWVQLVARFQFCEREAGVGCMRTRFVPLAHAYMYIYIYMTFKWDKSSAHAAHARFSFTKFKSSYQLYPVPFRCHVFW